MVILKFFIFQFKVASQVYISRIEVYETYNAGGVVEVSVFDHDLKTWATLWSKPEADLISFARKFKPTLQVVHPMSYNNYFLSNY